MSTNNTKLNPQGEQMADESMIRTLAAQIEAIWPQERALIDAYGLPRSARVLDVGAGTGEFSAKIAAARPDARVIGVELLEASVEYARTRHAALAPRLTFEVGDAFALAQADDSFDLVANRHMVQSVPHVEKILAELVRVTKPGGRVHVLAEDYSMLHFMSGPLDPDVLWRKGPVEFSERTGTDSRIGRRAWSLMRAAGLVDVRVDYVIVDTLRVPRRVFADIITAWRDGYVNALATPDWPAKVVREQFDEVIASILNPDHYGVWHLPIVSGLKP
ncbi:MAG TPA: methyltransferase domain-containing protein [Steroidobacteraceae bacterium]|jgi:SAM-dependent methyltransferase|nr:methyltransferase domain-containing protein [Steroidobacteraceae bacterium]